MKYVLAINPGSISTKIALFEQEKRIWLEILQHSPKDLSAFEGIWQQLKFRLQLIEDFLSVKELDYQELSAVVGRGGLLKPITGGTYLVTDDLIEDARKGIQGEHGANLGCGLAAIIARKAGIPAYVVDPVSVDEFEPLARYSGHPLIERRCLSHALSIHAVARMSTERLRLKYSKSRFIVVHLGGGISIAPVRGGKIIDVNDASSDGPFSPERTGGLPLQQFIKLCFSGKYKEAEMRKLVMGKGGLWAYLGTKSAKEVEARIEKDDSVAEEIYQAMTYQIAKEIGSMSTVLYAKVDAIVLTGGLTNSAILTKWIKERVEFIAQVLVLPGEFEMEAMNLGVLRVLRNEETAQMY